ncbi:MAG: methyltransferase domain-containing protein [Gemmataceae bacterium]
MTDPADRPGTPHFEELARAERTHFWFTHRNRVLADVFRRLTARLPDGYQVLEVGCGTGNVLEVLEQVCERGRVAGSELFEEGLAFARTRVRCPLVAADIYDMPFGPEFDLLGLFDVLEHLPDDRRALGCLARTLRPGGRLVITVPAHRSLWSYADVASEHYRRYSPRSLRAALAAEGYEVEYLTQFMAPLFPLMWLGRRVAALMNRMRPTRQSAERLALNEFRVNPVLNAALSLALRLERPWLAAGWGVPVGTSLLAVASRPGRASALAA